MTTQAKQPKINLPPIEDIAFAVFRTKSDCYYVVCKNDKIPTYKLTEQPGLEWLNDKRYQTAKGIRLGDWEQFFLVCNADCFDPPKYITSAQHEGDALEQIKTETDVFLIEQPDLADYNEDSLDYDDNGRPMDCEQAYLEECVLVLVITCEMCC